MSSISKRAPGYGIPLQRIKQDAEAKKILDEAGINVDELDHDPELDVGADKDGDETLSASEMLGFGRARDFYMMDDSGSGDKAMRKLFDHYRDDLKQSFIQAHAGGETKELDDMVTAGTGKEEPRTQLDLHRLSTDEEAKSTLAEAGIKLEELKGFDKATPVQTHDTYDRLRDWVQGDSDKHAKPDGKLSAEEAWDFAEQRVATAQRMREEASETGDRALNKEAGRGLRAFDVVEELMDDPNVLAPGQGGKFGEALSRGAEASQQGFESRVDGAQEALPYLTKDAPEWVQDAARITADASMGMAAGFVESVTSTAALAGGALRLTDDPKARETMHTILDADVGALAKSMAEGAQAGLESTLNEGFSVEDAGRFVGGLVPITPVAASKAASAPKVAKEVTGAAADSDLAPFKAGAMTKIRR